MLKTLITTEGRSVEVPPPPEKKKTRFFRFLLALFLLVAVCSPFFFGNSTFIQEGSLPKAGQDFFDQITLLGSANNVLIVLDFPADLPLVLADQERIRQVFNNLLSNAIKYAPQGGEVRIGGWRDGDHVMVYVADQGIGIPDAEQAKLFQRFYRVDSSLRRSTQGAGLGLFLCRSIIEAHGGRIWLRSEPGMGTTVFFTLAVEE